jgi:hypothetical protein
MKRWKTIVTLLAAVALAYMTFAPVANTQPTGWLSLVHQDPQGVVQFRVMSAYGGPAMPGFGTAAPTAANSGLGPQNGEMFLVRDNAQANEPVMTFYSGASAAWRSLPVSELATNAPHVANSVWFGTNQLLFEGAAADAGEFILTWTNSIADVTITVPADNADWDGTASIVFSELATNAPHAAHALWGGGTAADLLVYEGATANGFELMISAFDPGADRTMYVGDVAEAAGSFVTSTVDNMDNDDADAIWFEASQIWFEGATGANAFETVITVMDPTVGIDTYQFSDNAAAADTYNIIFSLLDTNALGVANSIWMDASQIIFEGATGADAFETILTVQDPTVGDDTYTLIDRALAADTYEVLAVPDGTWTTGNLIWGEYTDASAAFANADNVMVVQRIYIPHTVTVTHIDMLNIDVANASAGDNTIAAAIYYDADAGAQIVELIGATDDGAGNATGLYTLDIADTTLHPGWYRIGFCAQDASDNDIEGHTANADVLLVYGAGAATGELYSEATNACVAGNPAATTGALAQAAHVPVFMLRTQ